jgi:hypothetical protein
MDQVRQAAGGDVETRVRTYITRPLWRMWNEATGHHPDDPPTGWVNDFSCRRVFGSETVVIESNELWSVSLKP